MGVKFISLKATKITFWNMGFHEFQLVLLFSLLYLSDFTSLFCLVAEKAKKEEEEECFGVLTLKIELNILILFLVLLFCINSIGVRVCERF